MTNPVYKDRTWCSMGQSCDNEKCKYNFNSDEEYDADKLFGSGNYDIWLGDRSSPDCGFICPDMFVDENLNGSFTISTIWEGYRVSETYHDYAKEDAMKEFSRIILGE